MTGFMFVTSLKRLIRPVLDGVKFEVLIVAVQSHPRVLRRRPCGRAAIHDVRRRRCHANGSTSTDDRTPQSPTRSNWA